MKSVTFNGFDSTTFDGFEVIVFDGFEIDWQAQIGWKRGGERGGEREGEREREWERGEEREREWDRGEGREGDREREGEREKEGERGEGREREWDRGEGREGEGEREREGVRERGVSVSGKWEEHDMRLSDCKVEYFTSTSTSTSTCGDNISVLVLSLLISLQASILFSILFSVLFSIWKWFIWILSFEILGIKLLLWIIPKEFTDALNKLEELRTEIFLFSSETLFLAEFCLECCLLRGVLSKEEKLSIFKECLE